MRDGATERQGRLPRTTTPAKQSPPAPQAAAGYRSDSDFDDESDWDFGVGNLVIDLDADIEKTKASNNNNTLSSNNNLAQSTASPSPSKADKMSSIEHQATVDNKAGIKMKIKRKNPSAKSSEAKHEIIKNEGKSGANSPGDSNSSGGSPMEKSKSANNSEKEKSKGRSVHGKKVKDRNKAANSSNSVEQISNGGNVASYVMSPNSNAPNATSNVSSTANVNLSQVGTVSVELDRIAPPYPASSGANPPAAPVPTVAAKKEAVTEDPYEFNVNKVEPERPLGFPVKKIKVEKAEMAASPMTSSTSTTASTSPMQDAGTETCHVGTVTEPECLGPCEPGTSVTLEGIVWQETENGVLVVNVTWRGKTYVGTLLDATKHDWAPPRFSCDSPTSDFEARTPKGRGKRRAAASNISLNENSLGDTRKLRKGRSGRANNVFAAPPSPAKSEASVGGKRKGRPVELELKEDGPKASKRCRSNSRGTPNGAAAGDLIECPEPNCNKKYKHINGLRYHQTHAHQNSSPAGEENNDEEMKEVSSEESAPRSPSPAPAKPEKPERSSKKGKKNKQANPAPPPPPADTGDLDDDDKPLSQISGASPKKKVQQEEAGSATGTPSKDKSKAEGAKSKDNDKKEKQSDKNNASVLPISGVSAPPQVSNTSQNGQASNQSASTGSISGPTLLTVPEIKTEPRDPTSEKSKKKGDKEKKNKSGASVPTVSRPLMPAPASVPVTSVAASHSQLPNSGAQSNLKPIQPKSAAAGEPASNQTAVPPVKRPKKKRKQDKDAPPANPAPAAPPVANNGTPQSQQLPVQMHQSKSAHKDSTNGIKEDAVANAKAESMSVIKTLNPSPLKLAVEPDNRTREQGSKMPPDITKSVAPGKEPMDLATKTDSRMARPPSSLSVNSPVQMSSESRDHNEDAQSPAYSDISDESAPTLEIEGAKPVKEEKMSGVENSKPGDRTGEHGMTNPYGMYYYGQPPYLIPAVPQQQGSSTPNSQSSGSSRPSPKIPPSATVTSEKDPMMMEIKQEPGLRQSKESEHENSAKKDAAAAASHKSRSEDAPNRNLTPSSVEYQQAQQQKMMQQQQQQQQLQQQMYGMSPYYYNYGIDPQYHMQLMASDPVYRQQHEKMVEQEKRRHQESKEGEKQRDRHLSSPSMHSPGSRHPQHGKPSATVTNPNSGSDQPHSDKRASPSKPPLLISERDRKMRELEKQNENHQILKENIELKNQMPMVDKSKYEGGMPYENEQQALRERQAEELQRYYLYQQQQRAEEERRRMMEHHKPTDLRKDPNKDKQSTKDGKEQDSLRERRPVDMHRPKEGDMKRPPMEKVKGEEDRGRQGSPSPRTTPKLKEGGAGPQSSTPSSMPTTYGQYLTQQAYLPSSHYTGIPSFDPSHPMYRAGVSPIIGYAGAPYLHPHQMRYMAGMEGVEKEKALASPGSASSTEPPSGKALDILQQHAAYYSPGGQHKIHELTEIGKARDLSNSSPAKGSDRSTPSADKTRSPPPQRHLHTHHHTHVVNPGYPLYDPYGALIASSQAASGLPYLPK